MRDALSLLDQCIAFYLGQNLTYDNVLDVLGAVDNEIFSRLTRSVIDSDVTTSLNILDEIIMQGREPGQFVNDFIWYLRNLMLIKTSDDDEIMEVIDASAERIEALKEEAQMVNVDAVSYPHLDVYKRQHNGRVLQFRKPYKGLRTFNRQ